MTNSVKKIVPGLVILAVVAVLAFWFIVRKPGASAEALDEFAQCLAQKGATMYGAYWCPHCQNEKQAFGDSFRLVPYIECSTESKKCLDAGIKRYPTWTFADGRKFEGEQGIEKLSQESECPLNR
ncbi:MAG: hypothetical protein AAB792_00240 [Patescibacteria group bacterium]